MPTMREIIGVRGEITLAAYLVAKALLATMSTTLKTKNALVGVVEINDELIRSIRESLAYEAFAQFSTSAKELL